MSKYWWLENVSLGCYNIRNKDIGYCTIQFYNLQWGGVSLSHFKVFWWKKTLNFFLLMIKVFSRTTSHILSFFVSMFTHFNHLHLNWNEEWHCYEIFCCDVFERQTMLLPPTPTRASYSHSYPARQHEQSLDDIQKLQLTGLINKKQLTIVLSQKKKKKDVQLKTVLGYNSI